MFFALKNLVSDSVSPVEKPWEWKPAKQYEDFVSIEAFKDWCREAGTTHLFYAAFEGMDPRMRIKKPSSTSPGNPARVMHALVLDFDAPFNGAPDVEKLLKRCPSEYRPAYVCMTVRGHCRMIWLYEGPLLLGSNAAMIKEFLKILLNRIKATKWFAGLDAEAALKTEQYYEAGSNWQPLFPDYRIGSNLLQHWMFEAARKINLADVDRNTVSLEKVLTAINQKFPGAWSGPFTEGARCRRFWDDTATNDTAAVLHRDGFICFSGSKPFVSWKDLLGEEWVDKAEADKLDGLRDRVVYEEDSGMFYLKMDDGAWVRYTTDAISEYLKTRNYSGSTGKGDTASQVDRIRCDLRMNSRVQGARPFIFEPSGVVKLGWRNILNTSRVVALQPATGESCAGMTGIWEVDGPKFFPWTFGVMQTFFDLGPGGYNQLDYLLSWIKHFYVNALAFTPQPGQGVFLAGPEGKGKTLIVNILFGYLMGGATDASAWMTEGSQWTDSIVEYPLILLDDSTPGDDPKVHLRFSSLWKKVIANDVFAFNGKWKANGVVRWHGRAMGLVNTDVLSQMILPNLDNSSMTKTSMLLMNKKRYQYPSQQVCKAMLESEAPYFARFLIMMKVPDRLINTVDTRFFLYAYRHPELEVAATQGDFSQSILELIQTWFQNYIELHPERKQWTGTSTQLCQQITATEGLAGMLPRSGAKGISLGLKLLAGRGYPVYRQAPDDTGIVRWRLKHPFKRGSTIPEEKPEEILNDEPEEASPMEALGLEAEDDPSSKPKKGTKE